MIRYARTLVLLLLIGTSSRPALALAEEEKPKTWSGSVSAAAKYESNVDLLSDDIPESSPEYEQIDDARVIEVTALLGYRSAWDSPWHLEASLMGLSDVFVEPFDDTWAVGRGNFSTGVSFGANEIGLSSEARYFTEPDDPEFDNLRNNASLHFRRYFSDVWQVGVGYLNTLHVFTEDDIYNYVGNGGYAELRSGWTAAFSTYYRYEGQVYQGSGEAVDENEIGAPSHVVRNGGEVGFESFFSRRHSLMGSYAFFADNSENNGASQIGEIQAEAENLDSEAEFDLTRHKATLLYTVALGDRYSLSFYNEFQAKSFNRDVVDVDGKVRERDDLLWLTSAWFKARLTGGLYGTARYLYRMNESTTRRNEFEDHVVLAGLGFEF